MRQKLRRYTPLMMGGGGLLFILAALILVYRAAGLDKGTAIYLALLTLLAGSGLLTRRYFHRTNQKSRNQPE